jgi:CRISPR/Cas system-associated exonuclease Cas4 (RecB family)
MSILNNNQTNQHTKDIHRYSFSRFKTFHTCPRKHQYQYVEQLETEESAVTIPGKLFHKCIEQFLNDEDMSDTINEFKSLCMSGKLDMEPDLLEYIVSKYLQYYAKDYSSEKHLMVEKEFNEPLLDDDYITLVVDQAVEKDNLITVRDIKTTTNKLKYTFDDVVRNQQLLLYVPYVENELQAKVDMIQIDEVRMAKLQEVPINKNGKPTADRRRLDLVSYEDYLDVLTSMGLDTEKEYQPVLDYLRERGHPLFNRVTAQVLDPAMVDANASDMLATYVIAKSMTTLYLEGKDPTYRVRGPLCKYCAYQHLCEYDMHGVTQAERDIIIKDLIK